MTTEIIIKNLGSLLPGKLNYSELANAFLTNGYVSTAQNVYFNTIRFAEGIIIKEDIGQGYAHTFLNGIRIYSLKDKVLLADRAYHCNFYSKEVVKNEAKNMLCELVIEAANNAGHRVSRYEAEKVIEKVLDKSYKENQRTLAQKQLRLYLPGN